MPSRALRKFGDSRWGVVALCVILLLLLPASLAVLPGESPREYPEKLEQLTEDTVVDYVSAYERAALYRSRNPPGDVDLHLRCPTALDRETDDGYYVTVRCWGSSAGSDGSSFAEERSFYLSNGTSTTRVQAENGPYDKGAATTGTFYLTNFGRQSQSVQIDVRPAAESTTGVEFDHTYTVRERSGIGQSHVVPPGRYVVTATLETDERRQFEWNVTEDVTDRSVPALYVTPGGELVVSTVPEPPSDSEDTWAGTQSRTG